jgi:hypothetical protein
MTSIPPRHVSIPLRWAILLISMLSLNGCLFLSSRVSEIGLRSHDISATEPIDTRSATVEVKICEVHQHLGHSFLAIPYQDMISSGDAVGTYTAEIDLSTCVIERWEDNTVTWSPFQARVDGRIITFDRFASIGTIKGDQQIRIHGSRHERRWYGYPAQLLLAVTIPCDVALDIVVGGPLLIVSAFSH